MVVAPDDRLWLRDDSQDEVWIGGTVLAQGCFRLLDGAKYAVRDVKIHRPIAAAVAPK